MKTITLANQKGGVGKSAIARLLAHYLVRQGKRVMTVDLDHQANLTAPLKLSGKAEIASFSASQTMERAGASTPTAAKLVHVPADPDALMGLERQPEKHNGFATHFRRFIQDQDDQFDVCIIDTNPNPDIRLICALVASDFVLSPIQLNQEAISGIGGLIKHPRVGVHKIKERLNAKLELIGLLPTLVEPTPFQKANFAQIVQQYSSLLIRLDGEGSDFAYLPRRSVIAESQASGAVLWEIKKTAARDVWREIEPSFYAVAKRMHLDVELSR